MGGASHVSCVLLRHTETEEAVLWPACRVRGRLVVSPRPLRRVITVTPRQAIRNLEKLTKLDVLDLHSNCIAKVRRVARGAGRASLLQRGGVGAAAIHSAQLAVSYS